MTAFPEGHPLVALFEREYARLDREVYSGALPPFPGVALRRMTRSYGRVRWRRTPGGGFALVGFTLNRAFETDPSLALDTIRHEIAHVAALVLHHERGHGAAWRKEALRCGAVPKACVHEVDAPVTLVKREPLAILRCTNAACATPAEVRVRRKDSRVLRWPTRFLCKGCRETSLRVVWRRSDESGSPSA